MCLRQAKNFMLMGQASVSRKTHKRECYFIHCNHAIWCLQLRSHLISTRLVSPLQNNHSYGAFVGRQLNYDLVKFLPLPPPRPPNPPPPPPPDGHSRDMWPSSLHLKQVIFRLVGQSREMWPSSWQLKQRSPPPLGHSREKCPSSPHLKHLEGVPPAPPRALWK